MYEIGEIVYGVIFKRKYFKCKICKLMHNKKIVGILFIRGKIVLKIGDSYVLKIKNKEFITNLIFKDIKEKEIYRKIFKDMANNKEIPNDLRSKELHE